MFKTLNYFPLRLALLVACFALLSACATTTHEKLRGEIDRYGLPYWKKAADEIKSIRSNVNDGASLAQLEELDKELRTTPTPTLLQKTLTTSNTKELETNMLWLRWELLSQNADGRFAYYYAQNLSRSPSLIGEAATFVMVGRLSLSIDGARCEDKSSYQTAKTQLENNPTMRLINEYMANLSAYKRAEMLMHAVSIEEMRGERKPQAWLCNLGTNSMLQAMNNKENIKVVPSNGNQSANAMIQIDTSNIAPKFIDDKQWREARKKILTDTLRSAVPAN